MAQVDQLIKGPEAQNAKTTKNDELRTKNSSRQRPAKDGQPYPARLSRERLAASG